jgi:hypothetical protein
MRTAMLLDLKGERHVIWNACTSNHVAFRSRHRPSNPDKLSTDSRSTLCRFQAGEDAHAEYVHAALTMTDPQSAELLKNMIVGFKALAFFSSKSRQKALIAPLEVRAAGKDVLMEWSWPSTHIDDLYRLMQDSAKEPSSPTTVPATQPCP